MKKQTTALLVSLLIVLLMTGLLVFLLIRFQGKEESQTQTQQEQQEIQLLSVSQEQINTIVIQNKEDSFTLVNQGEQFAVEGLEEAPVSSLKINQLTAVLQNFKAQRQLIDLSESPQPGSSESLTEYGLQMPSCQMKVTMTDGSVEELAFGDTAPDGESVYLLYGQKVYLADDSVLDSISQDRYSFLDNQITEIEPEYEQATVILSGEVRPSPITLEIKTTEQPESESAQEGVSAKQQKEYTLTTPLKQTITEASASQATEGLFGLYANAVEAVSPTPDEMINFGLENPYSVVSFRTDTGDGFTLKTSKPDRHNYVYLMKDGSPTVYLVSASRLSWLTVQTEQLTQSIYVPAQAKEVAQLQVYSPQESYDFVAEEQDGELQVSCNGQKIDGKAFEKLYQTITAIPPEEWTSRQSSLEPVLEMIVSYRDKEREADRFSFIPLGDGSVLVSLNGESRYAVNQSIVYQILENCKNALEGKEISLLA